MCDINRLPAEMLFKIFQSLAPRDLKTVVLVCPLWRKVGEDPTLWTWAVVKINTRDDFQKLNTERLGMLQEIEVLPIPSVNKTDETFVPDLFKAISKIPTVRRIHGLYHYENISKVDPDLLVSVANRLEQLTLFGHMTTEQLELMFRQMAENTTHVKALVVGGTPTTFPRVRQISAQLFASAVSNVVDVVLCDSCLPPYIPSFQQIEALFVAITRSERSLKKLSVALYSELADIDPDTVGSALNRLEEVQIHVNVAQLTATLRILVYGESRLKKLMVEGMDPADVEGLDPDLVKRAQEKIGNFYTVYVSEEEDDSNEDEYEDGEEDEMLL